MIELPRRSITRFFIPLIDVLTLLFCIYLLMPIVQTPAAGEESAPRYDNRSPLTDAERAELNQLRREKQAGVGDLVRAERTELERLHKEKIATLQKRLAMHILDIDEQTGRLYYYDPERIEIRSEADAQALIARDRRAAAGRELYYMILYPRQASHYPEIKQKVLYERWFAGVAHGFDNPSARR